MRLGKALFCSVFLILNANPLYSQQSDPRVTSALQSSLTAMLGANTVQDVTLSGSAQRIAGTTVETGTAKLSANSAGFAQIALQFSSGTWSESRSATANGVAGAWSSPDGVQHSVAGHNLLTTGSWFSPCLFLQEILSSKSEVISYVGQESRSGVSVLHFVAISTPIENDSKVSSLLQHLSQLEIYLDSGSFLPVALQFSAHPDNDLQVDIPIEIQFSNYQVLNGIRLPLHLEKYVNNTLALDLTFQSAAFNTGVNQ